jgi:hypothetical protein
MVSVNFMLCQLYTPFPSAPLPIGKRPWNRYWKLLVDGLQSRSVCDDVGKHFAPAGNGTSVV